MTISVSDACEAVPRLSGRVLNDKIGATEYCQLLAGVSSLHQLDLASNGKFSQFADHGRLRGAYGPRIFSQLRAIAGIIEEDGGTRQAVAVLWGCGGPELASRGRDVPCTVSLQFMLRDGALSLTVVMRSSDAWLGVPYDWWQHSRLQLTMASAMSVTPGAFTFFASSLHLYEKDVEKARATLGSSLAGTQPPCIMAPEAGLALDPVRVRLAQEAAYEVVTGQVAGTAADAGVRWYSRLVPPVPEGCELCERCRYFVSEPRVSMLGSCSSCVSEVMGRYPRDWR